MALQFILHLYLCFSISSDYCLLLFCLDLDNVWISWMKCLTRVVIIAWAAISFWQVIIHRHTLFLHAFFRLMLGCPEGFPVPSSNNTLSLYPARTNHAKPSEAWPNQTQPMRILQTVVHLREMSYNRKGSCTPAKLTVQCFFYFTFLAERLY